MLILCDRANRRGVKNTDFLIRKGNIPEQIRSLVSEKKADVLVLGRPLRGVRGSVFTPDEFDRFVQRLQQESGIKVIEVIHELKDSDMAQNNSGG